MRRSLLAVAVLTIAIGCQKAKPVGPAWPAPSTTADDGGQSIDPPPTAVATLIEKSKDDDDDDDKAKPDAEIIPKPGAASAEPEKSAVDAPASQATSDEVIMSEEIIIEIED